METLDGIKQCIKKRINDYTKLRDSLNNSIDRLEELIQSDSTNYDDIMREIKILFQYGKFKISMNNIEYNIKNYCNNPTNEHYKTIKNSCLNSIIEDIKYHKLFIINKAIFRANETYQTLFNSDGTQRDLNLVTQHEMQEIILFLDKNIGFQEKVIRLTELANAFLVAHKEKDNELEEILAVEKRKRSVLSNRRNNHITNIRVFESPENIEITPQIVSGEISNEQTQIIERVKEILKEEEITISTGFNDDVLTCAEICEENNINNQDLYDLALSYNNCKLVTIFEMAKIFENKDKEDIQIIVQKLEKELIKYDYFTPLAVKEKEEEKEEELKKETNKNKIIIFENEHKKEFEKILTFIGKFQEIDKDLKSKKKKFLIQILDEATLSVTQENIEQSKKKLEDDKENKGISEDFLNLLAYGDAIDTILKNTLEYYKETYLTIDLYNEYKMLEKIYLEYCNYKNCDDIKDKRECFDNLILYIKSYELLYKEMQITPQPKKNENIIFILTLNDGRTMTEEFISKKQRKKDFNESKSSFKNLFKFLKQADLSEIFASSDPVKDDNPTSKRKLRQNSYRIVYQPINLSQLGFPMEKDEKHCYLTIAIGYKHGEKTLYDFVNTDFVNEAIDSYLKTIQEEIKKIKEMSDDNEEAFKEAANKYLQQLITQNEDIEEKMCDTISKNNENEKGEK